MSGVDKAMTSEHRLSADREIEGGRLSLIPNGSYVLSGVLHAFLLFYIGSLPPLTPSRLSWAEIESDAMLRIMFQPPLPVRVEEPLFLPKHAPHRDRQRGISCSMGPRNAQPSPPRERIVVRHLRIQHPVSEDTFERKMRPILSRMGDPAGSSILFDPPFVEPDPDIVLDALVGYDTQRSF